MTHEKYRNHGLFSTAFDKVLTMIANEKRELKRPFEYSVSMTSTTAVRDSDASEVEYVMNLPAYAAMWRARFVDNELQNRWIESGKQIGRDRMPLGDFLQGDKIDEQKIDGLIKDQKILAEREGSEVRGLYLSGHSAESHAEVAAKRKHLLAEREERGITRVGKTAWEKPATSPTAVVAQAMSRARSDSQERQ